MYRLAAVLFFSFERSAVRSRYIRVCFAMFRSCYSLNDRGKNKNHTKLKKNWPENKKKEKEKVHSRSIKMSIFSILSNGLDLMYLRAHCGNMAIFNTRQWWTVDVSWSHLCAVLTGNVLMLLIICSVAFRAVSLEPSSKKNGIWWRATQSEEDEAKKTQRVGMCIEKRALCFHVFSVIKTLFSLFSSTACFALFYLVNGS